MILLVNYMYNRGVRIRIYFNSKRFYYMFARVSAFLSLYNRNIVVWYTPKLLEVFGIRIC